MLAKVSLSLYLRLMSDKEMPASGKLLVAKPLLGDPNFDRTVVLLIEHNDQGSLGFVVNNPLALRLADLLEDFTDLKNEVYSGGPVQQDNLFFIHRKGDLIPGSQKIGNNLYWGGEIDPLKELIRLNLIQENDIRFYLGYSGWAARQLDMEMEEDSWLVLAGKLVNIFEDEPEEMWSKILMRQGGDYQLWANSPFDPNLN